MWENGLVRAAEDWGGFFPLRTVKLVRSTSTTTSSPSKFPFLIQYLNGTRVLRKDRYRMDSIRFIGIDELSRMVWRGLWEMGLGVAGCWRGGELFEKFGSALLDNAFISA